MALDAVLDSFVRSTIFNTHTYTGRSFAGRHKAPLFGPPPVGPSLADERQVTRMATYHPEPLMNRMGLRTCCPKEEIVPEEGLPMQAPQQMIGSADGHRLGITVADVRILGAERGRLAQLGRHIDSAAIRLVNKRYPASYANMCFRQLALGHASRFEIVHPTRGDAFR